MALLACVWGGRLTGATEIRNMSLRMIGQGLLFATTACAALAAPDKPFYRQEESAQHFVLEKGRKFRLFRENSITWGEGAQWDDKEKLTDTPCFRILDESDKTAGHFRQHHPMWVAPCTEYLLTYMIKVDKLDGAAPSVECRLYDYNTDIIGNRSFPADVAGPTGGWVKREVKFNTDYFTHELMLQLSSDNKGTCDVRFDKVYLEQVSEPGALMPPPKFLLRNESVRLDRAGDKGRQFPKTRLPPKMNFYRLSFDIGWKDFDGNATLTIDWLGKSGDVIGRDYCAIYRIEGVVKDWNGIATRWKRQMGKTSDKASFKLDWHYNAGGSGGKSSVEYVMKGPAAGRFARIRIEKGEGYEGRLHCDKLTLIAEY